MTLNFFIIFIIIAAVLAITLALTLKPSDSEVLWVATGNDEDNYGNIMFSFDGTTWNNSSDTGTSFSAQGLEVAYGSTDGDVPIWVATGQNEGASFGNMKYSYDGKSWADSDSSGTSFSVRGNGAAYGTSNGSSRLWVAAGEDGTSAGNLKYSEDGKKWIDSDPTGVSFGNLGHFIAYGTSSNGVSPFWVAVGNDGGVNARNILYSGDGKFWLASDDTGASFRSTGLAVAYGTSNGVSPLWVAVGVDGSGGTCAGNIKYSEDGKFWHDSDDTGASFGARCSGIAYHTEANGDPLWVAVGVDGPPNQGAILYSTTGKKWQEAHPRHLFTERGSEVAFGKTNKDEPLWVAVGDGEGGNDSIISSSNGINWEHSKTSGDSFSKFGTGVASTTKKYGVP